MYLNQIKKKTGHISLAENWKLNFKVLFISTALKSKKSLFFSKGSVTLKFPFLLLPYFEISLFTFAIKKRSSQSSSFEFGLLKNTDQLISIIFI